MKSFLKSRQKSPDVSLNITSMADIFTILLVFLLKSYASSAIQGAPHSSISLPQGNGMEANVEALKIEISEKGIAVEGEAVQSLDQFQLQANTVIENGSIEALNHVLKKARERQNLISKANATVQQDSKVIILADQRTPYRTLKAVLASSAYNGFTDFKLAVVRRD
jgi:biopolymer transport protein ExbD